MMHKKNDIVIGLTTFNNEMLKISVPALGKLRQKFTLVIHNNNPATAISRRQIRRLGYCGDLQIINSDENIGELRARIEIINAVRNIKPNWIIFCDDDDILIDVDVPLVACDNFAVIKNTVVLQHRVSDLLRVMENPTDFSVDGENVILQRPNISVIGTPIRANILFDLIKIIPKIMDGISQIDEKLGYYPPVKAIMWNFINIYARYINQNATPIYMDKISYIKNNIDTTRVKYECPRRPARNAEEHYQQALAKYDELLQSILNMDAALRG